MSADHTLAAAAAAEIPAPELDFRPRLPRAYRPRIGLIGCGAITQTHLEAYRHDGLEVVALCDVNREAAEARRSFYPDAAVYTDARALLDRADIDVVDVALHPDPRLPVLRDAILAGKHVLSQKPFVRDLDQGAELVRLAEEKGVRLAVNQNGRWAPYARYALLALRAGLVGEAQSVAVQLNWDHTWIRGKAFERIHHLILYDFAVHWFDLAVKFMAPQSAVRAFASAAPAPGQDLAPPMLASAAVQFEQGQASFLFDGHARAGAGESIVITGTAGAIRTRGPVCACDVVELHTAAGVARPRLEGHWFREGFRGAMGELLCAIEENREPEHSARDNLRTLELVFAVIASADSGQPVAPGAARRLGDTTAVR